MEEAELNAEVRKEMGTASARRLRAQRKVPAVIYGKGMENVHITIKKDDVKTLLAGGVKLVKIRVDGKEYDTILQEVQVEPIGGGVLHIDFHKVELTERVSVEVPVEILGEPKCPPTAGVLEKHLDTVTVECMAADVPKSIVVDVRGMGVGDVVHISDLELPKGVKTLEKEDEVVVSIVRTTAEEEVPVEEEEEPEVAGRASEEKEE